MGILVEVCCGSVRDVLSAKEGGAERVELNSGLYFGGLTPSAGMVREAKKTGMEIMAMVRPREGGFCYTEPEFETMLADTEILLENGADGIVFGCLRPDLSLDTVRCERLLRIIGQDHAAVFHRAIDLVGDQVWELIDQLCELGFRRILTSGQQATAWEGRERLRQMNDYAAGRIEILPGSGVRAGNIRELCAYTRCTQAHTSGGSVLARDDTALANPRVRFTPDIPPPADGYRIADAAAIAETVAAAR